MAWASVRCKPQGVASPRRAAPPIAAHRTAAHRPAPQFTGGSTTGAPPHPSTQLQAVWWVDTCHRRISSPCPACLLAAFHRASTQRGLRPTHITRCRRTSRAGAACATPRNAAQLPAAPRIATQRGRATSPHPTSQPVVVRWADAHCLSPAPHIDAPLRIAPQLAAPGALRGSTPITSATDA